MGCILPDNMAVDLINLYLEGYLTWEFLRKCWPDAFSGRHDINLDLPPLDLPAVDGKYYVILYQGRVMHGGGEAKRSLAEGPDSRWETQTRYA